MFLLSVFADLDRLGNLDLCRWWAEVWYDDLDDFKEDASGGLIVLGVDGDLEVSAEYR